MHASSLVGSLAHTTLACQPGAKRILLDLVWPTGSSRTTSAKPSVTKTFAATRRDILATQTATEE